MAAAAYLEPEEEAWRDAFETLRGRFPDANPQDVVLALRRKDGHPGRAAMELRRLRFEKGHEMIRTVTSSRSSDSTSTQPASPLLPNPLSPRTPKGFGTDQQQQVPKRTKEDPQTPADQVPSRPSLSAQVAAALRPESALRFPKTGQRSPLAPVQDNISSHVLNQAGGNAKATSSASIPHSDSDFKQKMEARRSRIEGPTIPGINPRVTEDKQDHTQDHQQEHTHEHKQETGHHQPQQAQPRHEWPKAAPAEPPPQPSRPRPPQLEMPLENKTWQQGLTRTKGLAAMPVININPLWSGLQSEQDPMSPMPLSPAPPSARTAWSPGAHRRSDQNWGQANRSDKKRVTMAPRTQAEKPANQHVRVRASAPPALLPRVMLMDGQAVSVHVARDDDIGRLRSKTANALGVRSSQVQLVGAGRVLADTEVIATSGVDVIHAVLHGTGQPDQKKLFVATLQGDAGQVARLIAEGADLGARYTGSPNPSKADKIVGATALHLAVASGDFKVAETLVTGKADLEATMSRYLGDGNKTNEEYADMTPLHMASMEGHSQIVEMLLAKGARRQARMIFTEHVHLELAGGYRSPRTSKRERAVTALDAAKRMMRQGHNRDLVIQQLEGRLEGILAQVNSIVPVMEELPTIEDAARSRKSRVGCQVDKGVNSEPRVEKGELCFDGRRCVRSWALGETSGRHCMLGLECCTTVVQHLGNYPKEVEEDELTSGPQTLWAVGCFGLGGADERLDELRKDLESKDPQTMLQEVREAVVKDQGPADIENGTLDWERSLRRLGKKAWCAQSDPCAYVRVQLWRELVRVHLQCNDAGEVGTDDRDLSDLAVLQWLTRTEQEMLEVATAMPADTLFAEAHWLSDYVARVVEMSRWLKEALKRMDGWQRFHAYRVLGLKPGATREKVRRAFYRKALKLHPDKGGDKEAFQELQQAYDEIMSDLETKEKEGRGPGEDGDDDEGGSDEDAEEEDDAAVAANVFTETSPEPDEPEEPISPLSPVVFQPKIGRRRSTEAELLEVHVSNLQRVQWLVDTAEKVKDIAARVAEHGFAALEESRTHHPDDSDWTPCRNHAEAAFAAAREVADAANTAADISGRVVRNLRKHAERWESRHTRETEFGTQPIEHPMREKMEEAAEASLSSIRAASVCLKHIRDASKAMERTEDFNRPLRLKDAFSKLLHSSADAAQSAASAAAAAKAMQEDTAKMTERRRAQQAGWEQMFQDTSEETKTTYQAQFSVSVIINSVSKLKTMNQELLNLQRTLADFLKKKEVVADKTYRERAFMLLAEFLDDAAIRFQDDLQAHLRNAARDPTGEVVPFDVAVRRATTKHFGFVVRSSPLLALPLDPRSQTLRAALALDAKGARVMLLEQLVKRMRGPVASMLCDFATGSGAVTWRMGSTSIDGVRDMLREALSGLEKSV